MKNYYTQKFGIAFTALALFMASCGSNATFSKRYHSRGFNIAWGGGSSADGKNERPATKRVKLQSSTTFSEKISVESVQENSRSIDIVASSVNVNVVKGVAPQKMEPSKMGSIVLKTTVANAKLPSIIKPKLSKQVAVKNSPLKGDPRDGKSLILSLVLCVFLGVLGIHRFYLGYTSVGLIQCAIGVVGLLFAEWIIGLLSIWILIDFIRMVTFNLEPNGGYYRDGELFDR
ncbi:MAG: TM2 domain-containing protein [Bacteroidota bacterium]